MFIDFYAIVFCFRVACKSRIDARTLWMYGVVEKKCVVNGWFAGVCFHHDRNSISCRAGLDCLTGCLSVGRPESGDLNSNGSLLTNYSKFLLNTTSTASKAKRHCTRTALEKQCSAGFVAGNERRPLGEVGATRRRSC